MNHLLCISLNSRGVKDEWAWKPGTSFMHPINTPCRYLYVSSSTSAWNARQSLHFLKNFCCIESVGFLGSESCHDPRSQVGKNSSTLTESKGKANLSLCQRAKGVGVQSSQAVAHTLISLRAKRQEGSAGGWEPPPMVICQGMHLFGFLHRLFSLDARLEEYFCSAGLCGVKAPKGGLHINTEWPFQEYLPKNFST